VFSRFKVAQNKKRGLRARDGSPRGAEGSGGYFWLPSANCFSKMKYVGLGLKSPVKVVRGQGDVRGTHHRILRFSPDGDFIFKF